MKTILYLVPDLMFGTRLEDAAGHLGYRAEEVSVGAIFEAVIADKRPDLVVLTFDRTGPGWEELASAAKRAGVPVLAFGSHIDAASFKRARELECDRVVPRSKMSAELPDLLKALLGE